jgi:hypothetical protein
MRIIKNKLKWYIKLFKIKVFNFGLSNENGTMEINLNEDGSSVFLESKNKETIELRDIIFFLKEENVLHIDLMKINIEGGEFQVIPRILKSGYIDKITNLQIQFHDFIDNAIKQRDSIRDSLKNTHELTYDYYFVWENWKKKKDNN